MWLTGFDVPETRVHRQTYAGHGLMQTIARVNRVYKDKEGGLIVDYLGIALNLKKPCLSTLMVGVVVKLHLIREKQLQ